MGAYTPGVHFAGVHASLAYGLARPVPKGFRPHTPAILIRMDSQKAEQEVQAFSVILEQRKRPSGRTEVREMKIVVVLQDNSTETKCFTAEYPCSLDTMLDKVKVVVDELRLQAE
jgi:hypothetical protein